MLYHYWHLACQINSLNLFQFQRGLNQSQFLFLSSKSFRIMKSMPLSSISKRLSKPPLLCKSALAFVPLLLLSYTQKVQALTAHTSRAIEGSAPYLTFDGGQTKATDPDTFLAIELPDGRRITSSTNTSSSTNPIMVSAGITFNDIHTVLPSGATTISLNSLIAQGKWGDDDGDGQGVNGVVASGSISVSFTDKDGSAVSRGDALDICKAPYKVTLSSTEGNLATQYGEPRSSTFSGGTAEYYITPPPQPVICSVRPNLTYGTDSYAGPANIWNPAKGFLVQSTNPSSYGLNFPTTGADGLYFDLDIVGVDTSQLSWAVNTSGSIRATVSWTSPHSGTFTSPIGKTMQADRWITDKSKNVTRVTLRGPRADSTQMQSANPSQITVPSMPQTFELMGRDSRGNEVRYGFVLRQWFVNRGSERKKAPAHKTWCNGLGYSMPQVKDLTNAVVSSSRYKRYIGGGLFTEWGYMSDYFDAGFVASIYWADNRVGANSSNGIIGKDRKNPPFIGSSRLNGYGICTVRAEQ